ncbi:PTS sugar transporter subunit IIA [Falsibacillus albus]|uniref:PTS glucose transporter subunit IIA n=1 Tax=Falsibacillus albus TaxID=2478915 RepID=A0A3L7JXE3_9BACI|nr:PTS glucose transporter subunit IIA [Falsibacillus albus]RLQ95190.1 PTS glucose transporter subunit IIA [Falsibacillus albus]
MLKNLFGKKEEVPKNLSISSPMTGRVLTLEDVPDPVFSQKMMGDGIAIEPVEGKVVAPFDGNIVQVFPTKHAIGIKSPNGVEVLIHIGLETVSMNGEGFETFVSEGDKVKAGDLLVEFSIPLIEEKAESIISPIIITNGDEMDNYKLMGNDQVTAGHDTVMEVTVN